MADEVQSSEGRVIVGLMTGHVARPSGGRSTLRGSSALTKICHAIVSPLRIHDARAISESNGASGLLALRPERPVPEGNAAGYVRPGRDDAGPAAPDREVRAPRPARRRPRHSLRGFAAARHGLTPPFPSDAVAYTGEDASTYAGIATAIVGVVCWFVVLKEFKIEHEAT
jgi:hypothetical protein